jgi:hypothetical protein
MRFVAIIEHPTHAELDALVADYASEQSKNTERHVQGCKTCLIDVDRRLNGERKPVSDMAAEFLREGGLLFFVFGILDALLHTGTVPEGWYLYVTLVSMIAIGGGVIIERKR